MEIQAMQRFRWFYLVAVLGGLAWSSGLALAAEPGARGEVPAYEKKVNWNVAVFLIDYQDIPAEQRAKWPTALEFERLLFHDKFQEYWKTISNGQFIVTGEVFDYTTSTATFWDSSGSVLSSQQVLDAVDFQVPGFQPERYDLFLFISGHDAALGGARTGHFDVRINGSKHNEFSIVLFFQIGYDARSTSNHFYNTLVDKQAYSIPRDDGTTEDEEVVYDMSGFTSTLCHEMGHALGVFAHANSATNGYRFDWEEEVPDNQDFMNNEYGNNYDIMGHGEYAVSLNGNFRNVIGLLPEDDIATFSQPGTFTTTLHPVNSTASPRLAEILLPFDKSTPPYKNNGYSLEVRNINWMDTMFNHPQLAGNLDGIFVIKTQALWNRLLDMSPSPNIMMEYGETFYDIRDVVLKPGMVYENDEVKLYEVVNHGDGSFSVTVDIKNDKTWTDAPENLTATTDKKTGQVRLDWKNNHLVSGSTGQIQIVERSLGATDWQEAPYNRVANDATSYVISPTPMPGESWEYAVYVREDATHLRSLNSNIVSNACNLKIESLVETNISCPGAADGKVEIVASGGTPPYRFGLSGKINSPSTVLEGLGPGTHSVGVLDKNKCEASATTVPIVEPRAIAIELRNSSGSSEVIANYGTGLYEYSVDGANWGTDPHLDLGSNPGTVYVRDQKGCIASRSTVPLDCSYTVSQPNGGEIWHPGRSYVINWAGNGADCASAVDLKLFKGGEPVRTIATQANGTSFTWNIPATQDTGTEFKIRVIDALAPDIFGQSASDFEISRPPSCNKFVVTETVTKNSLYEACETLVAGPNLLVLDGRMLSLRSGLEIEFLEGFKIESGASMDAVVCGQSLCETSAEPMPYGCHTCVDLICKADADCCDVEYTQSCLNRVYSECGLVCE
jgi:hypothetical protein